MPFLQPSWPAFNWAAFGAVTFTLLLAPLDSPKLALSVLQTVLVLGVLFWGLTVAP